MLLYGPGVEFINSVVGVAPKSPNDCGPAPLKNNLGPPI